MQRAPGPVFFYTFYSINKVYNVLDSDEAIHLPLPMPVLLTAFFIRYYKKN